MDENNQGLQWSHIEPLCILRALARQLWMLLLAALTCAMAAWIVLTCFVTQQYTSSTTFSVTTRTSNLYYTNITAAADVAAGPGSSWAGSTTAAGSAGPAGAASACAGT